MHPTRLDQEDDISVDDIPDFTQEELFAAVDSLANKKAPGPDGILAYIHILINCNISKLL